MNINRDGGSSTTGTQTYEAKTLISAAKPRAQHYQALRGQFQHLRSAFQQITNLGSAFQGKGAEAIKGFYAAQVNVVDAWLRLIDKQIAFLNGIPGEIDDQNLGGDTFVQMPFLEQDLASGYYRSKTMIAQQKEDIGRILRGISDLVPMDVFSTHDVDQALDQADHERNQMIHDVRGLDQELTTEYRQVTEDLPAIAALYGELIQATRQGADVQPLHFNAQDYHDSKIYQLQGEMEKETQGYLENKRKQEKARQVKKEGEDRVESVLQTAYSIMQISQKINDAITTGLLDVGKDTIVGLWDTVTTSPVEVIGNVVNAAIHPLRTYDIIKTAIVQSYERDMVHGNAYSRSRWITYALAMVATSVVGIKGVDKVGKVADLSKLSSKAGTVKTVSKLAASAAQAKVRQAATRVSGGLQLALTEAGGTPYNVINSAGLRDQLLGVARQNQGNGFFNQLNQARNLIQQASAKKVEGVTKVTSDGSKSAVVVSDNVIRDGSHMEKYGKLKPNIKYQAGEYDYLYKTDEIGRLEEFNADDLKLTKRENRLSHKSNTPGKEPGDHAGHLAADRFGGSPDLDNLVSQSSSVNLSKYKKLENLWAKSIKQGKRVAANVKVNYNGNSLRPTSFEIKYSIDGIIKKRFLKNSE